MALIQFTRNHRDHSTDKGFQFEFFCDRCGNGFKSEFIPSAIGMAASVLRTAGGLFGGILGSAGSNSYEIERAIQGPAHDKAFREAVEAAKSNFRQCPKCPFVALCGARHEVMIGRPVHRGASSAVVPGAHHRSIVPAGRRIVPANPSQAPWLWETSQF